MQTELFRRPFRLFQIVRIEIDRCDFGSAFCEFECVKSGIAADIEDFPSGQIFGEIWSDFLPFIAWKILKRMIRSGLRTVGKMKIVKPWTEIGDLPVDRSQWFFEIRFEIGR